MFSSYYKRLATPSSLKLCLNCKPYSKAAVTVPSSLAKLEKRKRRVKEEASDEKTVVPPEYIEYVGSKSKSLLELFPRRLFRKTQKPSENYYLIGNGKF